MNISLLEEKLEGAGLVLADFIKRFKNGSDEDKLRVLREILANQQKIGRIFGEFFLAIRLILGGSSAVGPGEFSECVAVGNPQNGFFASGILLSEKWLLTSSHCRDATKMFVGIDVSGGGRDYPITYKDENDLIVLFEVGGGFAGPVTPPNLPEKCDLVVGTPLRVVAFGKTDPNGGIFGQERQARFRVDKALDVRIYASSDSGICPGDSGGPVFYDDGATPRLLLAVCDSMIGDDCESGGVFATLVGKKAWIEQVTGLTLPARCP